MTSKRASVLAALFLCAFGCERVDEEFLPDYPTIDLLIENGRIVDGLGGAARDGDIAVVGDSIVFVGDADLSESERNDRIVRRIDAAGKVVAPGFIDLHAHGDPLETPAFENFLAMGVTTIVLGQDGSSPEVDDLSAWLQDVDELGTGPNLAMFVGHGMLRTLSGIGMNPDPTADAMARMTELLNTSLDVAFGLSTGLEYNPGLHAGRAELETLARTVGARGRLIMSHMRNEDDDQLETSIAELLDQGEFSRVHISHLKSVYGKGTERADEILRILVDARQNGVEITADMYPYAASYTGIAILFPVWAKTVEQFEVARVERRDELATYLRNRVNRRNGPEATLLGTEPYTGRTLAELAHELEMPFEDVLIDVIGPAGASGAYFVMNDELQARLVQSPYVGFCSDGSPTGFHPRGHGTFARVIERFVERDSLLSLPTAVQKMTSFAAGVLSIDDRGSLERGKKADIVIFDPREVRETATYPSPFSMAEGFDVVIVNGRVAREGGRLTPLRHGRVLRPE